MNIIRFRPLFPLFGIILCHTIGSALLGIALSMEHYFSNFNANPELLHASWSRYIMAVQMFAFAFGLIGGIIVMFQKKSS
jgi:hypothetical protein